VNESFSASSLISGYIEAILLKVISLEDCYGYSISKSIAHMTDNGCQIKEATLYSGLRRLESEELISSYWGEGSQGGRRKYYSLTQKGSNSLDTNIRKWEMTKNLMDRILGWRGRISEHE